MIRVLNVMEDGRIAGPQLRMLRVAEKLQGRIDTVIAIPDKGPQDFKNALDDAGISYVQLPLTKLSRNPKDIALSLIRLPWEVAKLSSYIRAQKIDVVHSSGGAWMFKAIFAAKFAGCPSVWHLNDTSSPAPFRLLARFLIRHWVAGVIVAGSRVKEHYLPDFESVYSQRVSLANIEAPVNTAVFEPKIASNEAAKIVKVVTVGNISPVKGYLTAVRAAEKLQDKLDFRWSIVGSSYESQAKYQKFLNDEIARLNVKLLSFFGSCSDVVEQLQNCDIYVCTSAAEASPTSVWEAMACGLPIVSTDVGCVRDYVKEGVNGYLVEPGDSEKMAQGIMALADNPDLRSSMGRENRKRAVESLDISVCAQHHEAIYSNVVQKQTAKSLGV